ncbi:40S ribosomal protein S5-1 [Hordeum vulgare]|nr:40S ribosomal protein S5-1 [Hordeum vulgare]
MREGMSHIHDVEGPKKTGSMETRLEAMEQQVFKCQGMVERGLNANHMMITEFTNKHMIDANDIGKHLFMLYDRIDQLQAQIYDLQNQNYECGIIREWKDHSDFPPLGLAIQFGLALSWMASSAPKQSPLTERLLLLAPEMEDHPELSSKETRRVRALPPLSPRGVHPPGPLWPKC